MTSLWPASMRRRAIGCPILPRPMNPMSIDGVLLCSRQKLFPDHLCMLAERGYWTVSPLLLRARRCRRGHADRPARRVDSNPAQVRVLRQERPVIDAGKGYIGGFELLHQFGHTVRGETRRDFRIGFPPVLDALRIGREFCVFAERGLAQNLFREHAPLAVILDRN